jgi:hypothetical protein
MGKVDGMELPGRNRHIESKDIQAGRSGRGSGISLNNRGCISMRTRRLAYTKHWRSRSFIQESLIVFKQQYTRTIIVQLAQLSFAKRLNTTRSTFATIYLNVILKLVESSVDDSAQFKLHENHYMHRLSDIQANIEACPVSKLCLPSYTARSVFVLFFDDEKDSRMKDRIRLA